MTQIPSVADGLLKGIATGGADQLVVGSPAWFAWLAGDAARSFSFRSPEGAYTARKERRQRGGVYWIGYRTAAGRQHKVYLGKGEELMPERLAAAAAELDGRVAAGMVGDPQPDPGASPARMGEGAAGLPLLATKLFVPRPRPDLVPRPQLLARLDVSLDTGRCSLLSAPAGAGKTSLLAAWLADLDRPVAWLTLDERDQASGRFFATWSAPCRRSLPPAAAGRWPGSKVRSHRHRRWWSRSWSTTWWPCPRPVSWSWRTTTWYAPRPPLLKCVAVAHHAMNAPAHPLALYRIRIRGHLDPAWSTWFDSLTVTQADDGTTELTGPLVEHQTADLQTQ